MNQQANANTATGIFARLRTLAANFRGRIKAKAQARDARELKSRFQVEEREGAVYITLDGVAIKKFMPMAAISDIVRELTNARAAASDHKRHVPFQL